MSLIGFHNLLNDIHLRTVGYLLRPTSLLTMRCAGTGNKECNSTGKYVLALLDS